uniref:Uncharacterized protein n=1 Tax=Rhizophora mucronata TaxID=61149 RepID=A0A2P2PE58_RHIMU
MGYWPKATNTALRIVLGTLLLFQLA